MLRSKFIPVIILHLERLPCILSWETRSEPHAVADSTFGKSPKILVDWSAGCHGPRALKLALLAVGVGQGQEATEAV